MIRFDSNSHSIRINSNFTDSFGTLGIYLHIQIYMLFSYMLIYNVTQDFLRTYIIQHPTHSFRIRLYKKNYMVRKYISVEYENERSEWLDESTPKSAFCYM